MSAPPDDVGQSDVGVNTSRTKHPMHLLRRSAATDADYLYRISELTLRPHVEALGKRWSVEKMQAKCRDDSIDPNNMIIQLDGQDCGVFCLETGATEVWLHALLLQPEYQHKGIGSSLLAGALEQARAMGFPLHLFVTRVNPARNFYAKFGFVICGEDGLHYRMCNAA